MKKTYLLSFFAFLGMTLFISCDDMMEEMGNGGNAVEGGGDVVEVTREISGFNKISVSEGINAFITMGDEESVRIEADEKIKDLIITEVVGNELKIHLKKNVRKVKKMNVYITATELKGLKSSSAANIRMQTDLETESFRIKTSSSGDIDMKQLTATDVNGNASSSGNIAIEKLSAQSADFDASSGSRIEAEGGAIDKLNANASSSGSVRTKGMVAKTCKATASSGGNIRVNISETLSANASSGGSIRYSGTGVIDDVNTSSGGSVKKD